MSDLEVRAFAKCRNERLRLPAFLDHYRALGVRRFVIADNESTDGSTEFLRRQRDVQVVPISAQYRETRGGAEWLNPLLDEFGNAAWCLSLDVDELLVYPGSEHASLPRLAAHLERQGSQAMMCLLLDMYPQGPLRECAYAAGDDPIAAAPWFDAGPYHRRRFRSCPGIHVTGGMRERVFFPEFRGFGGAVLRRLWRSTAPCLTKVPLVKWDRASRFVYSNHWVSPKAVAPETGVLLHVKFFQDFHERAAAEARRKAYYRNSVEYRRYAARLERDPAMTLSYPGSTRFEGTSQLVALGLMTDTPAWKEARASGGGESLQSPAVDPVVGNQRGW
jgi:hypothetical protein